MLNGSSERTPEAESTDTKPRIDPAPLWYVYQPLGTAPMTSETRGPYRLHGLEGIEPEGKALERALWIAVGLGVGLRLLRYLLRFPLWVDEAKLATSLLDRGFVDLLEPLVYGQTSPIGYLWLTLASVKLLGFNEWGLRLVSCAAAIGAILLVRRAAGRLLTGLPLLLAVGLVSVSYYPVRFAGEVKPYSMDLFVAAALLALAVEWWVEPKSARRLWMLALIVPIAITLSNPAIFIAAGIGLGLALPVVRTKNASAIAALAVFGVVALAAFWANYTLVDSGQYEASVDLAYTTDFWTEAFPPLGDPVGLAKWLLFAHTGRMFGYPIGFDEGGGAFPFIFFVVGGVVLYRRGRRLPVALLVLPFVVALVAAALRKYPYGLSGRISQWAVPAICLLAPVGFAWLVARLASPKWKSLAVKGALGFLALFGLAQGVMDIVHPYKAQRDQSARDFARWFWVEKARDAELVCAWNDLRLPFAEPRGSHILGNSHHWCNQRIYSLRHRRGGAADLDRLSAKHPLRVVFLESMITDPDNGFAEWLTEMRTEYQQIGTEQHKFAHYTDSPDFAQEKVVVLEFKPRRSREEKQLERRQRRQDRRQDRKSGPKE